MAEDNPDERYESTKPIETDEIDRIDLPPEFPDREELLRTMEMDSASAQQLTRPMQPIYDQTTRRHDVPSQLLNLTRGNPKIKVVDDEWIEFDAIVDEEGTIVLPEALRDRARMTVVTVRVKLEE